MHPLHNKTPLVFSKEMRRLTGKAVWIKMEVQQPSGSFKLRGIGHACQVYHQKGVKSLICASGGNAGLAVAYAGRQLGLAVTVVVPQTTSPEAIVAIKQEEAIVKVYGKDYQEAHDYAMSCVTPQQPYVHSYDHPLLWKGHASLIDELKTAPFIPDLIVLSVGGGGLLCGVVEGLMRNGWNQTPVLAVETQGAHALALALQVQKIKALPHINSIATSLGARQIAHTQTHTHRYTDKDTHTRRHRYIHVHTHKKKCCWSVFDLLSTLLVCTKPNRPLTCTSSSAQA